MKGGRGKSRQDFFTFMEIFLFFLGPKIFQKSLDWIFLMQAARASSKETSSPETFSPENEVSFHLTTVKTDILPERRDRDKRGWGSNR